MIMLKRLTNAAFLTGFLSLYSLAANASGLPCAESEVVIWSCSKKEKVYSICASKDLGAEVGYMQYRAGRIGKTEFTFPSREIHPRGQFTFSLLPRGAGISFTNGEYMYFIAELLTGETVINVEKDGSPLAEINCTSATDTLTKTTMQNYFKDIGIYK